jgi:hypothetical protein
VGEALLSIVDGEVFLWGFGFNFSVVIVLSIGGATVSKMLQGALSKVFPNANFLIKN